MCFNFSTHSLLVYDGVLYDTILFYLDIRILVLRMLHGVIFFANSFCFSTHFSLRNYVFLVQNQQLNAMFVHSPKLPLFLLCHRQIFGYCALFKTSDQR